MTSTPDCFAITGDTPHPDQHEARDRFLALVADARTAVQATLAPSPEDGTGHVRAPDYEHCGDQPCAAPADGATPSPALRLERVVSELLDGGTVQHAQVRVVG